MSKGYYYKRLECGATCRFSKGKTGKVTIEVKLNDVFARLQGYDSVTDMLSADDTAIFDGLIDRCGKVPSYLPIQIDGEDSEIVKVGKVRLAYLQYVQNL